MSEFDVQIRFNGTNVDLPSAFPISLSGRLGLMGRRTELGSNHNLRKQFLLFRRSVELGLFEDLFPGEKIRASFSIPGDCPQVLDVDPPSKERQAGGDINIACSLKLFVASVMHDQIARRECSLNSSVADMLAIPTIQGVSARDLSIRDLLNHRHGLNDDGIHPGEFLRDGGIDVSSLLRCLNRNRAKFRPGLYYGYSRSGYWLIAALLQNLAGANIREILAAQGLTLGDEFCPAMGGEQCRITSRDLQAFLLRRLYRAKNDGVCAPVPQEVSNLASLPGWHILNRGLQFGWQAFSRGWLGHNSYARRFGFSAPSPEEGAVGIIRVHPETGAALHLWANRRVFSKAAAFLFGALLPESDRPVIPRRLKSDEWLAKEHSRYLGVFRSGSGTLRIHNADKAGLHADFLWASGAQRQLRFLFVPAEDDLFHSFPVRRVLLPYIQFVYSSNGNVDGVWNGVRVWPKVGG